MSSTIPDPRYIKRNYLAERKPRSLGGVEAFMKNNTYKKRSTVVNALRDLSTFVLHRPTKTKFKRRFYKCPYIGYLFAIDLADYQKYARNNDNIRYLLIAVECLSRFVMVAKLKNKTSAETAKGLALIFKQYKLTPERVVADGGLEFWGKETKEFLKKNNVKLVATSNPLHVALIEVYVKIVKTKISHYQTKMKNTRFVDALDSLVHSINNSWNNVIGGIPAKMRNTVKDNDQLWHNIYHRFIMQKPEKIRFSLGDLVLVSSKTLGHEKSPFIKGYVTKWDPVVYRISEILNQFPVPFVRLKTTTGPDPPQQVSGMFYQGEITKVNKEKFEDE